jgi:hypothetical protein
MIDENITSALILEDDIDWDVGIHQQFENLSYAMHALTHPNPLGRHIDPTYPTPRSGDTSNPIEIKPDTPVTLSKQSPYGDEWGMLWVGHCAASLPDSSVQKFQRGRVVWEDETVPEHQYLSYNGGHHLVEQYPNHTRAVHHALGNVCTFGIAVTQKMAKQLLYHLGVQSLDLPIDLGYRAFCEGAHADKAPACYTVEPPLFTRYRRKGDMSGDSDISVSTEGQRGKDYSPNIRYSVMQNLDNLVHGRPVRDIAPDGGRP